jgi:hypothetical protein
MRELNNFLFSYIITLTIAVGFLVKVFTEPLRFIINQDSYRKSTDSKIDKVRTELSKLEDILVKYFKEFWREK